ncbi:hypothetical protein Nepgr_013981 [Nepenthes gracilis]|uniref:Uncharacterized protein n=1 Tax=Nepenthes gracilis TaxID=150966 RepID=A0AAD3SIE1_NEPGR|nr:hypothetical protein Nepgr_013981 [Nepenthes gracilis]
MAVSEENNPPQMGNKHQPPKERPAANHKDDHSFQRRRIAIFAIKEALDSPSRACFHSCFLCDVQDSYSVNGAGSHHPEESESVRSRIQVIDVKCASAQRLEEHPLLDRLHPLEDVTLGASPIDPPGPDRLAPPDLLSRQPSLSRPDLLSPVGAPRRRSSLGLSSSRRRSYPLLAADLFGSSELFAARSPLA